MKRSDSVPKIAQWTFCVTFLLAMSAIWNLWPSGGWVASCARFVLATALLWAGLRAALQYKELIASMKEKHTAELAALAQEKQNIQSDLDAAMDRLRHLESGLGDAKLLAFQRSIEDALGLDSTRATS